MAKKPETKTTLGVYDTPKQHGMSAVEVIAIALSAVWLLGSAVFFLGMGGASIFQSENQDTLQFVMTLLAVFLPVAVIWVAASAARSARIVREESRRLQSAIDAMRQTYVADRQAHGITKQPEVEKKLDEIVQAAKQTETAVATFTSSRERPASTTIRSTEPKAEPDMDQPALQLGTPPEALEPPVERSDFIRALNFPETAEDQEGFSALRRALKDRKAAALIQASQDVLTLLSQDGIYMDDLRPDQAKPDLWRRFAQGERGQSVAVLGGIRDRSSLALSAGRMRSDAIFRDAVHHFLRKFDTMLGEFEQDATDEDIAELSNTRTARAFMLMGRVTGMFS